MRIDLFIPPAIDADLGNVTGWLIRCKPEDDCASLFSMDTTLTMYGDLNMAVEDTRIHAETCPHDHAVVAVASNEGLSSSVEDGCGCQSPRPDGQGASREPGKPSSTEPLLFRAPQTTQSDWDHPWTGDMCERTGCVPVGA